MSTFQVINTDVMNAKSAQDTAVVLPTDLSGRFTECSVYVVYSTGTSAGSVVVETAHLSDFTGTWANLATVNWAAQNRCHVASITGIYRYVRIRIATAVADGTVSVYVVATN